MMGKREQLNQRRPHPAGADWFYVGLDECSFHLNAAGGKGMTLKTSRLLRALQAAGILQRWDAKQQILRSHP